MSRKFKCKDFVKERSFSRMKKLSIEYYLQEIKERKWQTLVR
ncbi:hypothetical protein HMPREF6123_0031 [Oribacterium sinus F0268]|uniref:Uncharacterized protein n=1 Tax=Oribacterium sinus F0268 TaxID=585501 RepID=C2KU62_9FIRM|nr:hypothetical protein HMPREF6123_0031 [Oribacterium sinus F0268]